MKRRAEKTTSASSPPGPNAFATVEKATIVAALALAALVRVLERKAVRALRAQ